MINLSIAFSFKDEAEYEINFKLENDEGKALLIYSDNGSGFKDALTESDERILLFKLLLKQIDDTLDYSDDNSIVYIKFNSD